MNVLPKKRGHLKIAFLTLFLGLSSLVACSSKATTGPPPLSPPALSWTSAFAQGTQSGPINFQSVGQTATLAIGGSSAVVSSDVSSGNCVTLSGFTANGTNATVVVSAASTGSCVISVKTFLTSTIQATVP